MSAPLETMREVPDHTRGLVRCLCRWGPDRLGRPVVALHGWLDQGAAFDAVAAPLGEGGVAVWAPDHRGHGRSAWAPAGSTYHFTEYLADLDGWLTTHNLQDVVLVGHSMGGTIASLYAGLRPERVAALVVLDGLGPPAVSDDDAVAQLRAFLDQSPKPRALRPLATLQDAASRLQRTNPALSDCRALALAERGTTVSRDGVRTWAWDPLHRTRAAVAFNVSRYCAVLRQIACPVEVFVGTAGWYPRLPDLDHRLGCLPPDTPLHEVDCGHDLHHAAVPAIVEAVGRHV